MRRRAGLRYRSAVLWDYRIGPCDRRGQFGRVAAVRVAHVLRRGQPARRRGGGAAEGRARRRGELSRCYRGRPAPHVARREEGPSGALGGGLARCPEGHPPPVRTYTPRVY